MSDDDSIQVVAAVAKVTTLADGGLRVTLDLAEDDIYAAAWLMEIKRSGHALATTFKTIPHPEEQDHD